VLFVSYSSIDSESAEAVCAALELHDLQCWMAPRDITPGDDWGSALFGGIQQADALVLVFSAHANHSAQIKREVSHAMRRGLPVLPFRLDDTAPGVSFALLDAEFAGASDASNSFEARVATLAAAARRPPDGVHRVPVDRYLASPSQFPVRTDSSFLRFAIGCAVVVAWVRLVIGGIVAGNYWFDNFSIDDVREYLIFVLPYHAASVALLVAAIRLWLWDLSYTVEAVTNDSLQRARGHVSWNPFELNRVMRTLSGPVPSSRQAWMVRAWWLTGAGAFPLAIILTVAGGTESATELFLLSMDLTVTICSLCMALLTRALTSHVDRVASDQPAHISAA